MALSTLVVASHVQFGSIVQRADTPQAISVPPSGVWLGNDGNWSTFGIQVGTPAQNFNVLLSTNRHEFSVPYKNGCPESFDLTNCGYQRGVYTENADQNGFDPNSSTSWQDVGTYQSLQRQGPYSVKAEYGLDTVAIGNTSINGQTQLVSTYSDSNLWLGVLGLDPRPLALGGSDRVAPLQAWKDAGKIPSLSYGYTAGAYYQYGGTPGSLTLGGFDRNLMSSQQVVAPIDRDAAGADGAGGALRLSVTSIKTKSGPNGDRVVSDTTITMPIDSTVPELWLPRSVCDQFQTAFNLNYSDSADRYYFGSFALAREIASKNPAVEFVIADGFESSESITISVPFSAFNLNVSFPVFESAVPWFPIRRAANETQYTLGRVFMQAAYVFADYERGNFTVTQTAYSSPMPSPDIVTVYAIQDSGPGSGGNGNQDEAPPTGGGGLSTGAKAGIAVGVVLAVVLGGVGTFLWLKHRRKTDYDKEVTISGTPDGEKNDTQTAWQANVVGLPVHELEASERGARKYTPDPASPLTPPSELGTHSNWRHTPELDAQEAQRVGSPGGSTGEKGSRLQEYR
ncbi:acid protease [Pseudovirgaria hyperparasitica]|uniref:Acid protease n=1 Tax=Pseudovirgaria hyperparasitica TaxID=470096 RepID=A0A6A6VXT8_9PEZI|nr:acid protease [Pseudovirgaria hyperparasitica]KAF2754504.1 acid protease [Pseudovirgaria hyperparasitica]